MIAFHDHSAGSSGLSFQFCCFGFVVQDLTFTSCAFISCLGGKLAKKAQRALAYFPFKSVHRFETARGTVSEILKVIQKTDFLIIILIFMLKVPSVWSVFMGRTTTLLSGQTLR